MWYSNSTLSYDKWMLQLIVVRNRYRATIPLDILDNRRNFVFIEKMEAWQTMCEMNFLQHFRIPWIYFEAKTPPTTIINYKYHVQQMNSMKDIYPMIDFFLIRVALKEISNIKKRGLCEEFQCEVLSWLWYRFYVTAKPRFKFKLVQT